MVGDSYVGKTSILKTYCEASQQCLSDTGCVETTITRNGQSIKLSIHDTGGTCKTKHLFHGDHVNDLNSDSHAPI